MKKKYRFILWDIDDTLIDFKASESAALHNCFLEEGVEITEEDIKVYSKINQDYWKLLEEGKVVKSEMLVQRFTDFITYLQAPQISGEVINEKYQLALGDYVVMYEDGLNICRKLQGQKKQYAVTNGTIVAQQKKLKKTGLGDIFDGVFISDEVGYQKPDIRFFQHCFTEIPEFELEEAIIIGDSLTSDMKGGNVAGIDCCWFNPRNNKNTSDLKLDFEITHLSELWDIIFD